ncbi:MAG TPA: pantoate--beta-alanine ligase, partial [Bacteroidia bacterium]|nr:pantoate--beta-alanine ligase [Bacteroidia bacterium]
KYPRTPDTDAGLLEPTGCHYLFMPSPEEMLPETLPVPEFDFKQLETTMEGAFRPGHFKGMAQIVYRFFDLIKPNKAYFGEKDFQQLAIVKEMNRSYHLGIEVIGCATVREPDGLAMSSRNIHLNTEERKAVPVIYASLLAAAEMIRETTPDQTAEMVRQQIEHYPFLKVQYISFVDSDSLQPIEAYDPYRNQRACIAVTTSTTRLIDNIAL